MKILVFGGTGFIGRSLINFLKEKGSIVKSVSRSGGENSLSIDITKESDFSKIQFQPDVVINCVSQVPAKGKTSKDPLFLKQLFLTNTVGAANITNWAVKNNIKKLINCSTLVVVKKPWPSPLAEEYICLPEGFHVGYAMSKLSQEQVMNHCVENSNTHLKHLRLSAVYGTEMIPEGLIFQLIKKFEKQEEVDLTNADLNTIDFIHVDDVCKIIYKTAQEDFKTNHEVLNVASGNETSISELAETIKKILGSSSEIKNNNTGNSSKANIDINKLKNLVGPLKFTPLTDGLKAIIERR